VCSPPDLLFLPPPSTLQGNTYTQTVYLLGNPAVIWMVFVFIMISIASYFVYLRYHSYRELQLPRLFGRFFQAVGYCLWT
jgi:dolichyl-phosphate-mannose--protein O-mannosyl transferase